MHFPFANLFLVSWDPSGPQEADSSPAPGISQSAHCIPQDRHIASSSHWDCSECDMWLKLVQWDWLLRLAGMLGVLFSSGRHGVQMWSLELLLGLPWGGPAQEQSWLTEKGKAEWIIDIEKTLWPLFYPWIKTPWDFSATPSNNCPSFFMPVWFGFLFLAPKCILTDISLLPKTFHPF